jgi:1-acyl-sn-glycerol-3-phosphate acyltransferase
VRRAQRLRFEVFNLELNEGLAESHFTGLDVDPFDDVCDHLIVEHIATGEVVGTYRLQSGATAAANHGYYSEPEFDFAPYERLRREIIELGRACVHAEHRNLHVLHRLWRGIAQYAGEHHARLLIGCSSLTSQNPLEGAAMYEELRIKHLVRPELRTHPQEQFTIGAGMSHPGRWRDAAAGQPGSSAFVELRRDRSIPATAGVSARLLRAYLAIGGKNLRTAGDRSRIRHDRLPDVVGFAGAARNRSRALSPMSAVSTPVAGIGDAGRMRSSAFVELRRDSSSPAATLSIVRAFAFVFFSLCALGEILLTVLFVRREDRRATRAAWLHRWCRFACRVLGIRLTIRGPVPDSGLLVCNHLSYLDIIVLSSIRPCIFVAKKDVAAWPLFGWLAPAAGTIFVDRQRKFGARAVVDLMRQAIADGALVVLFPEGTSSDGASVLPFKSALLKPALQLGCPITAAAINYSLLHGSVADEVCYWRDMTLVPHLLNLFSKASIQSTLSIALFKPCTSDRKQIALELRCTIMGMRS